MALAICPARQERQRSLRRMCQVLSWAFARSSGARSLAWAELAAFCGGRLAAAPVQDRDVGASADVALVGQRD
jgi:hypothetical protein